MSKIPDSSPEHEFLGRAVTMLAGDAAAKELLPAAEQALARAQEASNMELADEPAAISHRRVTVSVGGSGDEKPESVTAVFNKRSPTATGPKKRKPIRVGGGACFSVTIGSITIKVCVEWEQKL